jgi:hypothetical protein
VSVLYGFFEAGAQGDLTMLRTFASALVLCLTITPASSQTSSSSHEQAAHEFLNVLGLPSILQDISTALNNNLIQSNPPLAPHRDLIVQWSNKYVTWEAIAPELAKTYTQTFTEPELREIIAFYRTRTGQKMVPELPKLMQNTAGAAGRLAGAHIADLQRMLEERSKQPRGEVPAPQ